MPQFSYRARNAQGGLVEGTLNCPDRSVAIRQIEQLQCIPIRIETIGTEPQVVNGAPATTVALAPATQRLKIPHTQLLIFTEQLAHLLQAGMTLDEALAILQKRLKHPRMQQMTQSLHRALVDGRSFSQALRDFPRIFPAIYVNLIAACRLTSMRVGSGSVPPFADMNPVNCGTMNVMNTIISAMPASARNAG